MLKKTRKVIAALLPIMAGSSLSASIEIKTKNAPQPIGPYSQAVVTEKTKTMYISGQVPLDTTTNLVVSGIKSATQLVMQHLKSILNQAGLDFSNVVKTTIFLTNMADFPAVNEVYGSFFTNIEVKPARETVQVAGLPRGAVVEISMIASF